jgi:hypothetical protein
MLVKTKMLVNHQRGSLRSPTPPHFSRSLHTLSSYQLPA